MSRLLVVMRKVCEWCGIEFDALTKSTKYCSHTCNSRAYKANARLQKKVAVEKVTYEIIKNKPIEKFKDNEFLKCAQAAKLLRVCKQTIYNLIYSKQLKAVSLSSRLICTTTFRSVGIIAFIALYKHELASTRASTLSFGYQKTG